ncbi:restriction endonuclease subunit S, partial [Campylobacter helveticus]|uniref:restriction endonuclease subunit S n=1 Tax=Campylobacter helveticus TaxID=28898 RepID=UPI0011166EFD
GGGKIPAHWEVKRLRHIFKEVSIKKCGNEQQLCATQSYGVIPKKLYSYKTVEVISSDLNSFKLVKKDNFVISLRSFEGGIEHSNYQGIISPAYTILEPQVEIYSFYFKFLFKSSFFISTLNIHKIGIREGQNISYASLQYTPIPLPPLQEQKEIAEFLDKKCEKIQNYINKKQKLITLLQEKKQALINEAVTKGLNPNIESKNSGIEYLGLIPHHWEVRRVATLGKFFKGSNISKNDLQDSGVCVVLYGDIYTKYEIKTKQFQSKIAENFAKDKTQILCGDLLFSGSGETKEDIGKCICYLGNEKAYVGGDVIVLRQMGQDSLFLSYVLNSDYIKYQKAVISKGEIIIHIYASNLRDLKIPLPPLQEQKEIAAFLDSKVAQIDSVIEKTKKQIELIKEYKNTLINEAVCGRINLERK